MVTDRDERNLGVLPELSLRGVQIEPTVERHDRRNRWVARRESERGNVSVGMNDVEVRNALVHSCQHFQMQFGSDLHHLCARHPRPERFGRRGDQFGRRLGSPGREQCDLVTVHDELVGQRRNDPFGTAVSCGRHGLVHRCNLGDPHDGCADVAFVTFSTWPHRTRYVSEHTAHCWGRRWALSALPQPGHVTANNPIDISLRLVRASVTKDIPIPTPAYARFGEIT